MGGSAAMEARRRGERMSWQRWDQRQTRIGGSFVRIQGLQKVAVEASNAQHSLLIATLTLKCSARRLHPHISCRPRPHRSQWVRHAPRQTENQQWAAASAQLPRTNPCERAPLNDATASGTPRLGCVRRHVGCTAVQTYQRQPVPQYGHQPCACTASILMPLSCVGGRRADIQYRSSCPCFTFLPLLMELVCRTCKSEDFGYSM